MAEVLGGEWAGVPPEKVLATQSFFVDVMRNAPALELTVRHLECLVAGWGWIGLTTDHSLHTCLTWPLHCPGSSQITPHDRYGLLSSSPWTIRASLSVLKNASCVTATRTS